MVAAGLADKLGIQVAYAIGVAEPVSIMIETMGTSKYSNAELETLAQKHFDFTPRAIIEKLQLQQPIYQKTAAYGHFGRTDIDLPWEATDMAAQLK
jgi:S-adenosylmethionine synthetase